jgi:hypothetical protein
MKDAILQALVTWFDKRNHDCYSSNYADTDDVTDCVLDGHFNLDLLACEIADRVLEYIHNDIGKEG